MNLRFLRNYNVPANLNQLGAKWLGRWNEVTGNKGLNPKKFSIPADAPSFYALVMFPYPSGVLHMGHVRVYTISDVISRFKRLQGQSVIHPMGWDAFGLPAENAAIERGINPKVWTESNIQKMKQQMELMLVDFDWENELATCNEDYYKWTQKIFLLMYEHGLAYKKEAEINWDPVDETVLANEQVDAHGKSWRSGALVEKRNLNQWFIGITQFAKELNADLDILDKWPDKVKSMQRHWIGESHGTEIRFSTDEGDEIEVFTSRPDTLFSVQYLALSLNHPITKRFAQSDDKLKEFIKTAGEKDGYSLPLTVSRPINHQNKVESEFNIPVYVSPYVLDYGSGAVMGCPAHDERDFEFWKLHVPNVEPLISVVPENSKKVPVPFTDNGVLTDNFVPVGGYAGMKSKDAAKLITSHLESSGFGNSKVNYRIRDWLISRQRYWGAPIPIIYCDSCGTVPVPDKDLPVKLPEIDSIGKGNPLTKVESFVNCKCPSCGGDATRDTDTMDTFMDSSWYFFRYLDSKNELMPFDSTKVSKHLPVDMYLGGIEHAILHLLYSRFMSKFLGSIGMWSGSEFHDEPIKQLVTQGMVQGLTFTDPDTGRFLKPEEVDLSDGNNPIVVKTGKTASKSYEKMSKSKYNGVDPEEIVKKYGADAVRAQMLFQAPIADSLNWNEDQIQGVDRWLRKVITLHETVVNYDESSKIDTKAQEYKNIELNGKIYDTIKFSELDVKLFNEANTYIKKIDQSVNVDLSFNTIISDLMKYSNALTSAIKSEEKVNKSLLLDLYKKLLIVMSPVTPCVAEESWELLNKALDNTWASVTLQDFPKPQAIESETTKYNVFINGKTRLVFNGDKEFINKSEQDILSVLFTHEQVSKFASIDKIKKIIKKPGMISLVISK